MKLGRREFIGVSSAMALAATAQAQNKLPRGAGRPAPPPPVERKVKVTPLFKSPDGFPNALESAPEGLWIGDQVTDRATLVDLKGKVLRQVQTESHNTSGMAVGGGFIWMAANGTPEPNRPIKIDRSNYEIVQCDMQGKTIKRHEVPFGGGGLHGMEFAEGKLWIMSARLSVLLQVEPETFKPLYMLPIEHRRPHGLAWDNGAIWCVFGEDNDPDIRKLDVKTGRVLEIIKLAKTDPDPHGLCMHDGKLYYSDAGLHPGWVDGTSKWTGWIARIDFV